jgi:hypothetical protein
MSLFQGLGGYSFLEDGAPVDVLEAVPGAFSHVGPDVFLKESGVAGYGTFQI